LLRKQQVACSSGHYEQVGNRKWGSRKIQTVSGKNRRRMERGATIASLRCYATRRCGSSGLYLAGSLFAASSKPTARAAVPAVCRASPEASSISRSKAHLIAGPCTHPATLSEVHAGRKTSHD